jgi:hypothetical protein
MSGRRTKCPPDEHESAWQSKVWSSTLLVMKSRHIALVTLSTVAAYAGVVCWQATPELCHASRTGPCRVDPAGGSYMIVESEGWGSVCAQAAGGHWGCANLINVECEWTATAQTYHDEECQDPKQTLGPVLLKANKAKQAALSDSGCPDSPAQ